MLYGALVFERIWMSGGLAIATPSLNEDEDEERMQAKEVRLDAPDGR
jgi:hypothetical protein